MIDTNNNNNNNALTELSHNDKVKRAKIKLAKRDSKMQSRKNY